jgi:hypothetical protein
MASEILIDKFLINSLVLFLGIWIYIFINLGSINFLITHTDCRVSRIIWKLHNTLLKHW